MTEKGIEPFLGLTEKLVAHEVRRSIRPWVRGFLLYAGIQTLFVSGTIAVTLYSQRAEIADLKAIVGTSEDMKAIRGALELLIERSGGEHAGADLQDDYLREEDAGDDGRRQPQRAGERPHR